VATIGEAETTAREAIMQAYLAAWNSRDPDLIVSFFAPDAVYEDQGAGTVVRGEAGIRAHAASVLAAFSDLRFELLRAAHGDDFTAGEWTATMTHSGDFEGLRATGRRVSSSGVDVARLDDQSRIAHLASYYDGAAIMRDLGLLPARGSRVERAMVRAVSLLPRRPRIEAPRT
jgi:steroid delta-isomerase-like uncharacterized protein